MRARVTGRVQGVFFRASTAEQARVRGLTGWVRNCDDGSVELEVEGAEALVHDLLAWCKTGPPAAAVERLAVQNLPLAGDLSFEVRR